MAAPLALVAFQLGAVAEAWPLALGLSLIALLSSAPPRLLELNTTFQMMFALLGGVAAWFIAAAITPEEAHWWSGKLTLAAFGAGLMILLAALPRLFMASPWGGYPLTAALGLFVVITASTAQAGLAFVVPGAAYVPLQLLALNRSDPAQPGWSGMARRHRVTLTAALVFAVAFLTSAALLLPPLADRTMRYFGWQFRRMATTGFSTSMGLGSLQGMVQSDRKVLRVFGPRTDYLRGVVYTGYRGGRWATPSESDAGQVYLEATPPGRDAVKIWTIGGDRRRLFLPLNARNVAVDGGLARVNDMGTLMVDPNAEPMWLRFEPGTRELLPVSPPGGADLVVPPEISDELRRLARAWTRGRSGATEQLGALQRKLRRDFTYSLNVRRETQDDPVVEFLTRGRRGHCEYFASSMALLSRSLGIPARVVAGYRVTEYNSFGGYYLVRERNAHSWVEAWVEGQGWTTYDPTPSTDVPGLTRTETPWVGALLDRLAAWAREGWAWLMNLEPIYFIIGGVTFLFCWLAVRLFVGWFRKRRTPVRETWGFDDPRPSLVVLLDGLSRRGETKRPREPLEQFAQRVRESRELEGEGPVASALLLRYAAWRYGGEGDPEKLDAEIQAWVERGG